MATDRQGYFDYMAPYAQQAAARTGLPVAVILAQWAHESGFGTSELARKRDNHAGIKATPRADYETPAGFSGYKSLSSFARGYSRVISQRGPWPPVPDYSEVLDLAAEGASAEDVAYALGRSQWAEEHYGRPQGQSLVDLIKEYDLTSYSNSKGGETHTMQVTVDKQPMVDMDMTAYSDLGLVSGGWMIFAVAALAGLLLSGDEDD